MKHWKVLVLAIAIALPLRAQEEGAGVAKGAAVDTTGKGYTAAFVIEPASRRVLFEENAHIPLPTASMVKMLTTLIVLEEIRDGRLHWDDPVTISARASKMGGSQVYLRAASIWPVKNLVIATMVQSANDAASALAEKVAGTNEGFADLMNARAKELGLNESQFYDPHGLPNSASPDLIDKMSAHDLGILGIELMKYPFARELAKIAEMSFQNGTLEKIYNPNHLINARSSDYYDAATGIKTGYSGPAGYCVTAAAKRGNMELVVVVMGARPNRGTLSSFGIATKLFNEYFLKYRSITPVKKGSVVGTAKVSGGRTDTVQAVAAADTSALVSRAEEKNVKVAFSGVEVKAPVKRGQTVGSIVVQSGSQVIAKIPAVAGADVPKQSVWKSFWPF